MLSLGIVWKIYYNSAQRAAKIDKEDNALDNLKKVEVQNDFTKEALKYNRLKWNASHRCLEGLFKWVLGLLKSLIVTFLEYPSFISIQVI